MASRATPETPKKSKAWIWGLVGCGCLLLLIVAGVIGVLVFGLGSAIAVPSLLRARISANEAGAIGDIRTVISAEVVYQNASGGRYGSLDCLAAPASCIRGYSGPVFISPDLAVTQKMGYQRTLELSGSGQSYTYIVVPTEPGKSGIRSFCGDSSGLILQYTVGAPSSRNGECDPRSGSPI